MSTNPSYHGDDPRHKVNNGEQCIAKRGWRARRARAANEESNAAVVDTSAYGRQRNEVDDSPFENEHPHISFSSLFS